MLLLYVLYTTQKMPRKKKGMTSPRRIVYQQSLTMSPHIVSPSPSKRAFLYSKTYSGE